MQRMGFVLAAGAALFAGMVSADVSLPNIFNHNMVLQRGQPVPVWGWAAPDEPVTAELADAQAAIASVVHPYANVQTLPRINSLFVTDTAANLDRVKQLLGLIDQPIEMKEELHIIRVLHAKASDIKSRLDEIIAHLAAHDENTGLSGCNFKHDRGMSIPG